MPPSNPQQPPLILLHGAPDQSIGTPQAKSKAVQVMQLDMSNDVLEELLAYTRLGKTPHIAFGRNPVLRYGSHAHVLESAPSKFRHELYQSTRRKDGESDRQWAFAGLLNHTLTLQKAKEANEGMEAALETMRNNMASYEQEQHSRRTPARISTPLLNARDSTKPVRLSHNNHSSSFLQPPTTPLKDTFSKSNPSQSNIHTLTAEEMVDQAQKFALMHLLACEPLVPEVCARKVRADTHKIRSALKSIASLVSADGTWQLRDVFYKQIDYYGFNYSEEDRKRAIDRAVRVFDRMRIGTEDPIWQKLNAPGDRESGKTLSRLTLKHGAVKVSTPLVKAKAMDKKTGLPKRADGKKTDVSKKAGKDEDVVKKAKGQDTAPKKEVKPSSKALKPNGVKKPVGTSAHPLPRPPVKEVKQSTSAKALLNKPKNPSPLSSSPPVNASDFEDHHPVHKKMSAIPSPAKSSPEKPLKRKVDQMNGDARGNELLNKRPRLDSAPATPKTKPIVGSSALKRKAANDLNGSKSSAAAVQKVRKIPVTNGHRSPQTSDDSTDGPSLALSWRQSVDMAHKFRRYYDRYVKLYHELAESLEPPSPTKRDELMKMHRTLEEMKRQINSGTLGS